MTDKSLLHQSGLTLGEQQDMVRALPWRTSWQGNGVHIDGCAANYYVCAACSNACRRGRSMARRLGVDPDALGAPNSGPGNRGGSAENYG